MCRGLREKVAGLMANDFVVGEEGERRELGFFL